MTLTFLSLGGGGGWWCSSFEGRQQQGPVQSDGRKTRKTVDCQSRAILSDWRLHDRYVNSWSFIFSFSVIDQRIESLQISVSSLSFFWVI